MQTTTSLQGLSSKELWGRIARKDLRGPALPPHELPALWRIPQKEHLDLLRGLGAPKHVDFVHFLYELL